MSVGKTLRFGIFARDSFTCQYCGRRPPEVILELDHIHPQAKGGDDDPINLLTACFDCNRGKRDKVITEVAPRPDADLMFLRAQQEIVEAQRYIEAQMYRNEMHKQLAVSLKALWTEQLTGDHTPDERQFCSWIDRYGVEEIDYAIRRTSFRFHSGQFGPVYRWGTCQNAAKYISGIMRSRAKDRIETGAV